MVKMIFTSVVGPALVLDLVRRELKLLSKDDGFSCYIYSGKYQKANETWLVDKKVTHVPFFMIYQCLKFNLG